MEAIKQMIKRRQERHLATCSVCSFRGERPQDEENNLRCDNFVILSALELLLDYALVSSGYKGQT